MKKLLIVVIFILLLGVAIAQEEPRYSFASMQEGKQINIPAGGVGVGKIYFYNIDGNRITHISLFLRDVPEGWEVRIEPELKNTTVRIDGTLVNLTENLHVEPSEVLNRTPEVIPEGVEYILIPGRGYARAKAAKLIVKVPEGEKVGRIENITINAVAEWLGQLGTVAIKQTRDFTFEVVVVAKGIEKVIPEEIPIKKPSLIENVMNFVLQNYVWVAVGIATVIILIVIFKLFLL